MAIFASNGGFRPVSPLKMRFQKFRGGFYFASQQYHAFSQVLISRKEQKFAKTRNLISRKLIRLKYVTNIMNLKKSKPTFCPLLILG